MYPAGSNRGASRTWVILLAGAAVAAALYWAWPEFGPRAPEPERFPVPPLPGGTAAAPSDVEDAEAPPATPASLEGTDELVRRLAAGLSSHPNLAKWLAHDELVRRFVVTVANVAEGQSPTKQLTFLEPREDFSVIEKGGRVVVDPRSYHRYDAAAEVVASLDAAGCAELYRELDAEIDAAWAELGEPGTDFDTVVARAIGTVLAVPLPEGEVELDPRVTTHQYADRRFEKLTPAQKQLLRMGPQNVRKVQEKAREVSAALGLDAPPASPSPRQS